MSVRNPNAAMELAFQQLEDRVFARLAPSIAQAEADRARLDKTDEMLQQLNTNQNMLMSILMAQQKGSATIHPMPSSSSSGGECESGIKRSAEQQHTKGSDAAEDSSEDEEI